MASIIVSMPCFAPRCGEAVQIHDARVGIRGRLAHQQPRLGRNGRFHRLVVAGGHFLGDHAKARQVLEAELAAAVITFVEQHHFVAGVQFGQQQGNEGRHAGGKQQRRLSAVQRRQFPLDHLFARIAVAAVFFAGQFLLDEINHRRRVGKRERRGAKNGVGYRVARLLACFAGVYGQGRIARVGRGRLRRRVLGFAHDHWVRSGCRRKHCRRAIVTPLHPQGDSPRAILRTRSTCLQKKPRLCPNAVAAHLIASKIALTHFTRNKAMAL